MLEAVRSLSEHVRQQAPSSSDEAGTCGRVEYVGWDALGGEFKPVASATYCVLPTHAKEGSSSIGGPDAGRGGGGGGDGGGQGSARRRLLLTVSEAALLDVWCVKQAAILTGIEAACVLLRIDCSLRACK